MCRRWSESIKTHYGSFHRPQRDLCQNISFVYGRAGFVLHVASKGDKVRVTRSTLGRNRKCCCDHQLLLIGRLGQQGLGLPRRCQIKRRFDHPPPNLLLKGVKAQQWEGLCGFIPKGYEGCQVKEHYLHSIAAL